MSRSPQRRGDPVRGQRARREGRRAEWLAAGFLLLTGWRIVGFRLRTPQGEIDLLARRGAVLAVIEVKQRATLEDALMAVRPAQQARLLRAATQLVAARPDWRDLQLRLDLVAMAPGRWPRHVPDAWRHERL